MAERIELELNIKGGDKAVKTLGQLEQELDQARQAIKEVEVGSDAFNKLASQIQSASSEVKTLEKQMEGLEPQQKAEAFLKMGEGIAGGFAVAQGAMGLMGMESESLEKIQVRVQSAIAIAQGVRMMSEAALMATTAKRVAAEKLAIVQSKIGILVTKGQAIATAAWATTQGVATGAVKLTTIAMKGLKLAIAATGIGALVIAIIAIGKAVYDWATATDSTATAQAKLNGKLVTQNEQFLKNRDLQKELAAAETENEKQLVRKTNSLNNFIEGLKENNERLKENEENLKNINDFSAEEQRQIIATTAKLHTRNKRIREEITLLDEKIDKTKEAIAADQEAEQKEQERQQRRSQRRSERKARRIQEAESLRTLEQEIDLLRIEDEDKRAAAKIEQDRQNALTKIKDAKNFKEQEALINEKFDIQEAERKEALRKEEQAKQDEQKLKDKEKAELLATEKAAKEKEIADKLAQDKIELEHKVASAKANIQTSSFELAKLLGGKNKKIQKGIAISETAFNTGKSITRALADIPAPFGLIQASIHGAIGAAQIAAIANEKVAGVDGGAGGGGSTDITESMTPASTTSFTLSNMTEKPMKAFVVESEITDSQAQMADINRRSTI